MKKWLKGSLCAAAAGVVGCCSLLLVGCDDGDNKFIADPIIYNGGIVSVVGDDIVFANSLSTSSVSTINDYNNLASTAFLAKANLNNVDSKFTSPDDAKKIVGQAVGFNSPYIFSFAGKVYYATPDYKHKTNQNEHKLGNVNFYRASLDGSGEKELLSTNQFNSSTAVVRALKYEGVGYLFVFDGTELRVVNLNNEKASTISSKATSVAIPKEGEEWNGKIYYTENKANEYGQSGNAVFEYNASLGKSEDLKNSVNYTATFIGRSGNQIFYTMNYASTNITKTYSADCTALEGNSFNTAGEEFYSSTVSNVYSLGNNGMDNYKGYIFSSSLSGSAQILYVNVTNNEGAQVFLENGDYSNILFTHGDLVYYSTSNGISSKSVATGEVNNIVEGMTNVGAKVGYDFYESGNLKNLYFYAQREYAEDDETEEDARDTNIYLYMIAANGLGEVKLVGQTVK